MFTLYNSKDNDDIICQKATFSISIELLVQYCCSNRMADSYRDIYYAGLSTECTEPSWEVVYSFDLKELYVDHLELAIRYQQRPTTGAAAAAARAQ